MRVDAGHVPFPQVLVVPALPLSPAIQSSIPCPVSERTDGGLTSMCGYYVLDEKT